MKINLKDNIWIEGFDFNTYIQEERLRFGCNKILYSGKTSEIPEELAKECIIQLVLCKGTKMDDGTILQEDICFGFKNYKLGFGVVDFETAKESIQSACLQEFCIIYKTN
jgi:hypothetical protein